MRIFCLLVVCALLMSCGKGEQKEGGDEVAETGTAEEALPLKTPEGGPIEAIPSPDAELSEFEKLADAHIRPYFDEAGTQSSLAVAPGDYFDLWVVAEFAKTHPMSAAEFKMILPDGVSVMGTTQSDSVIVSMGRWDRDYMTAFRCSHGPKMWLVKYQCKAEEEFTGGQIQIGKGQDLNFLGFTMCDATRTLIRATPGTATLTKK